MSSPDDPYRPPPAGDGSAYGQPLQPGGYGAPQAPDGAPPPGYGPPAYGPPAYGPPAYGPPAYGPPAYGPPAYGPPPGSWPAPYATQETSSRAIAVLVCAIASFVVFPVVPAVVALALAGGAQQEIRASGGRVGGEGLVQAGRIIAWTNVALAVLVVVIAVIAVVVAVSGSSTTTGSV